MAASDNVLRGGLTAKHIDVDELLAVVDTTPAEVPVQPPSGAVTMYDVPVDDFALRRVHVDGEYRAEVAGPSMVLATSGAVTVSSPVGDPAPVPVGRAVFATADESVLVLRGIGEVFIAQPGAGA
jgi:mannose-6-phosphate isomerase